MPDLAELSEGETALRAVERDWNAAAQNWNSPGLVALYTEDALFLVAVPAMQWATSRCVNILIPTSERLLAPGSH
jgi:ketosteroid isomerase-like protein